MWGWGCIVRIYIVYIPETIPILSSVGISVYRFFTIFQSADIAGIVIEKISPYRLFPICRLFVDIENVYQNNFHKIYYNYLFATIITLKLLSEIVNNTE